ncbi:MAG: histidine kinase [Flavobacteriales bacterium]|nr:MAG: histidine kinase [Flavobacteriales bacterium]
MQDLKKHLIRAFAIGTVIYFVVIAILYFSDQFVGGFDLSIAWREYYETMIFSVILYFANAYWIQYLLARFRRDLFTAKRFLIAISGNVVISLLGIFLSRLILFVFLYNKPVQVFLHNEQVTYYKSSMVIAMVLSLIFYGIWYYKHIQENKVKEQKIIAGTAAAKFDALKNQLDPHFLFNSLNVLTSLIEEDPHQAQKFTTSLSKVYRYVLEQKNKDLVSVDEELEFARTYVRLLKMRFEDGIIFEIPEKSSNPEAKIVPLSLQLLLENAVKHNVVTKQRPLHIKVFEQEGVLVVKNNLQEKQVVKKSSGVGLQNIRERYGILSDKKVRILKTDSEFSVLLPILMKEVSVMESQKRFIEDKRYERAKKKVEAIKGFYGNLISYCIVIPILVAVNMSTSDFPWVIFPALGWGFGVLSQGMEAFGYHPIWGKRWQERKMRQYMEDDRF